MPPSRRLVLALAALVTVLAGLAVPTPQAWACDCDLTPSADEFRDQADVVFTGEVARRDDPRSSGTGGTSRVYFSVDAVHKGTAASNQVVVTPTTGTSCGLNIVEGPWLVFARHDAPADINLATGEVYAIWCGGTTNDPAPDDWPRDEPGPKMDIPVPPVVWWLSGAGVLVLVAGVIMLYRLRLRPRQHGPGRH